MAKKKAIDMARMEECVCAIKERQQAVKMLEDEIEQYKDEVISAMESHKLEEMTVGVFTVRCNEVISTRFQTKEFKEKFESLYNQFCKLTSARKFTIT